MGAAVADTAKLAAAAAGVCGRDTAGARSFCFLSTFVFLFALALSVFFFFFGVFVNAFFDAGLFLLFFKAKAACFFLATASTRAISTTFFSGDDFFFPKIVVISVRKLGNCEKKEKKRTTQKCEHKREVG